MTDYAFAQNANEQPDMTIDAATRSQIIENLAKELNDSYIFAETAKKMETDVRARLKNKEYDQITSAKQFSQKLTEDLQAISKDGHLRVRYSSEKIPARAVKSEPTAEEIEQYKNSLRRNNYGFVKVENMRGNIGYIDFRGFTDPELGAETVAATMNFVANTDALIFDLRNNGGGDPAMVALICSYLFGDKPVHLNDLYYRVGNKTEEYWTKPTVSGKKYGETKDVYVLTSKRTFSGAEEFANNLKVLKRATIVGETTGGGANPGGFVRLNDNFGAFVPTGRAINPITKTNWEGTGVEPDVKVDKELALKTAYSLALNKSLEKAKETGLKNALKQLIEQTQKELDEMKKSVVQK
ncbi:MAG TPA: S41 family peptidase [Pyrinomonadaceae bacterium]